ncbi:serine/threonine-protein kinase [Streptomyces polyrhachis]|uniref:non-specific serine/threonine protein kinase n=1 Tax=Streptomyces polyrhachis TaxID=1282885 RepID=A0ABW2GPK2_9ACTN
MDHEDAELIAGRYRLGSVLGRGGMGTVWRARDEVLGRIVAVKELRFPSAVDEEEKRRLVTRTLREAKAIARIRNTSAVTVYDVVEEDDRPWIVMELVEGRSLADAVKEDGPLTPRRAAEVGLAVLDVLRAAHGEGILHRDVKPSNVLIGNDGRVVLTDFGIAQVEGDPSITSTGMLVGAPSYISPERARGHKPGPASDLWSLGGLLYAAVEGHPPYDLGSAIATLTAVMTKPIEPPRNAGPLEEVIYGLLEKDPERRLDDAGARALLRRAIEAPEVAEAAAEAVEATKVVPVPVPPVAGGDFEGGAASSVPAASASADGGASAPGPGRRAGTVAAGLVAWIAALPRRVLVVIAAVVALALVGTVLGVALSGGEPKPDAKGKGAGKAAQTSPPAGKGSPSGAPSKSADSGDGSDEGKDKGKDKGEGGKTGEGVAPAGFRMHTERQFPFAIALPKGWKRVGTSTGGAGAIFAARSGGLPRMQVDFTSSPKGTDADAAYDAWKASEPGVRATSSGYRRVSLMRVTDWRPYPSVADWQFVRSGTRVLNRGIVVDGSHGYAIMITCPQGAWNAKACAGLRKAAFSSFEPTD